MNEEISKPTKAQSITAPLQIDDGYIRMFLDETTLSKYEKDANLALQKLDSGNCEGRDFLGWLGLPTKSRKEIKEFEKSAKKLKENGGPIVAVGIGGSYLGHRAVISMCGGTQFSLEPILYAGQNVSSEYHSSLLEYLSTKPFNIIVISKSGTTTEPALAFRLLREKLEKNVGKKEAAKRIIAITDAKKGALRTLADKEGYETHVIPDDVGGRYSVFSPVGLVPIACAGIDISSLLEGASDAEKDMKKEGNLAVKYASIRNALYSKGKIIEIFANFDPRLHYTAEWWKQLFGESEGKKGKGIYPASVDFTTDLHSLGQLIQEGQRNIFETFVVSKESGKELKIPSDDENLDKLNYLAGKNLEYVNKTAYYATAKAHAIGGVPNLTIWIKDFSPYTAGYLLYFFEKACGISALMLGVNPFDQPGVEAYKKEMFTMLGKK